MSFPEEVPACTWLCLSPNSSDPFPVHKINSFIKSEHTLYIYLPSVLKQSLLFVLN